MPYGALATNLRTNSSAQTAEALLDRINAAMADPTYRLPTLRWTADQLVTLTSCEGVSFREVDAVIRRDPVVAARAIAAANSPVHNASTPILSLRGAMMKLGWSATRDILWQAVSEAHVFQGASTRLMTAFQVHCVAVAHLTRLICRDLGIDSEHAFVCGLLHDLGQPFSIQIATAASNRTVDEDDLRRIVAQTHCRIGQRIAEQWMLPAPLPSIAAHHHDFDVSTDPPPHNDHTRLLRAVVAADRIVHRLEPAEGFVHDLDSDPILASLRLDLADIERLSAAAAVVRRTC